MTETVTPLRAVSGTQTFDTSPLGTLRKFVVDNELLVDWEESDVELDRANGDEIKLGSMNLTERVNYCIGTLLQEVLRQTMIDIEANSTDHLSAIMREQRLSMPQAMMYYRENVNDYLDKDDSEYLNKCAITIGYTMSAYEWSVRQRFNCFDGQLIVREGFVAYSYNG